MTPHFDYKIDDKLFYNRFDFVNYCLKQNNPTEIFNTGEFRYNGLPDHVDANNVIDPLTSTSKWMNGLRQNNKPVVLLFSGGLDGIFALDCMIRSIRHPTTFWCMCLIPSMIRTGGVVTRWKLCTL